MRAQFVFFESYARAISRIKNKAARADAYDAIVNFSLYDKEPDTDKMSDAAAIVWELSRPSLEASKKRAEAGSRGGKSDNQTGSKQEANDKQTGSKPEANDKQTGSKQEAIKDKGQGIKDKGLKRTPSNEGVRKDNALAAVMDDFLNRVNPDASQRCLEELAVYVETLGEAVCKRAFDIALDEKKPTWSYIRAILRDKQAKGIKSLADWDAVEQSREKKPKKPPKSMEPGTDTNPTPERIKANADWLDEFLAEQETGGG